MVRRKTITESWNDAEAEPPPIYFRYLAVICFMAMYYVW